MEKEIFIGGCRFHDEKKIITGGFTEIDGESYYKITNYDQMDPFFMTIASNSDHWMFISSNGALTAGRRNPDNALFPYYTVDKIQDCSEITGSKSLFLVKSGDSLLLWEPFSERFGGIYQIERNIYKSVYGNKIIFEEINENLGLAFSYRWMNSEKYGFIRRSGLKNISQSPVNVLVLDGIQNISPAGVSRMQQLSYSNLVDAYRKNELIENGIALFMLSSIIVDKAEPSESLNTTVVWSCGFEKTNILLSASQMNSFRKGQAVRTETDIRATRGAYFINTEIDLLQESEKVWYIIAEVNKNADYIATLQRFLSENTDFIRKLEEDVNNGTNELLKILSSADGLQVSRDKLSVNRHLSNVFYNVTRGGIFVDNYIVSKDDFLQFIRGSNITVFDRNNSFLEQLDELIVCSDLINKAASKADAGLKRLCYEYMPLVLSRRHGDPSRPWNLFSIDIKKEDGSKDLNYQGNWRDIFQNWEALGLSYPSFVESMICKFLNASTADGYNPYRITRNGIDWESPDPHDPWASIGYWGDHQIIYLLKLLELSQKFHPGVLNKMLSENIFAYANVPYRIKSYKELITNPFETIDFDFSLDAITRKRVEKIGSDGKLIWDNNDEVVHVNLTEKILVTALAKLSNYIPGAGIWMNTQRPEWNDANNALVGNGVSMVTLYYLRRFLKFCSGLIQDSKTDQFFVSEEVDELFKSINNILVQSESILPGGVTDEQRKSVIDSLGSSASNFRKKLYSNGLSANKNPVKVNELTGFFKTAIKHIDHTIYRNRRDDNLYHSYNLVTFGEKRVSIRHLYEMLEGQVAVLSSGFLKIAEVNEVLEALRASAMFRKDQYSYVLYPDRTLPRFIEKNIIPPELIQGNSLLTRLVTANNKGIITKDDTGAYHFNSNFRNASDLKRALERLKLSVETDQSEIDDVMITFEKVFDHQSFTGRSGTFYGFEGLGCIYWHMVSKLLLAIGENYFSALNSNDDPVQLGKLSSHYFDVRAGIGLNKSPELYGAFPTDAYSHTPGNGGARQPGMTGQVKEDIIARFFELGVLIQNGQIIFNPGLLRRAEFLDTPEDFHYITLSNEPATIKLSSGCLAFTCCQVPFIYHLSGSRSIAITTSTGMFRKEVLFIDSLTSQEIFSRTDLVKQVDVYINPMID